VLVTVLLVVGVGMGVHDVIVPVRMGVLALG